MTSTAFATKTATVNETTPAYRKEGGIVCTAAVDHMADGDSARVARHQVRFAGVVFPGETIVTSMWREGDKILLDAKTKERGSPVVSNAATSLRR